MVGNIYLILSLMKNSHDFEYSSPPEPEYLYKILIFGVVKKSPHCLCSIKLFFNWIWWESKM